MNNHPATTGYFLKASKAFYIIAMVCFTVGLLYNQVEYVRNSQWGIIIVDAVTMLLIYFSFFLYLKNTISLRMGSAIYVYATISNFIFSIWYYYYSSVDEFSDLFLLNTFFYCIHIVIAGFCVEGKHAYIVALLYVILLSPLIFISGEAFLYQNLVVIFFLILAFSFAVYQFLYIMEKTHWKELAMKDAIFQRDQELAHFQNEKLKVELDLKHKELAAKTMCLVKYAENNEAIIKKLDDLKKGMEISDQQSIVEIIQQHRLNHLDKYWREFEALFMEVNPHFYKTLLQAGPELRPMELKLAALVHLGLSSKQIASLTCTTVKSVDVARSRLRKKLRLTGDANLQTFLLELPMKNHVSV